MLGAASGRNQNHRSRKKRKRPKEGKNRGGSRPSLFCVFFRSFGSILLCSFGPSCQKKQDVAPLQCRNDAIDVSGRLEDNRGCWGFKTVPGAPMYRATVLR